MRLGPVLLLACGWLAGCQSKLDQLTSGGGCRVDDTVAGVMGRCPNEQLACALGWFDRDGVSANGCEGTLQPSSEYTALQLANGSVIFMTINEYDFVTDTAGGWVAIAGPACQARISAPCHYDLLAFQLAIPSFRFDGLMWTDGLLELPKPLPVVDNGEGLIIPPGSTFVASFVVEGEKHVVSQGAAQNGAAMQTHDTTVSFTMDSHLQIPFGGYKVEHVRCAAAAVVSTH